MVIDISAVFKSYEIRLNVSFPINSIYIYKNDTTFKEERGALLREACTRIRFCKGIAVNRRGLLTVVHFTKPLTSIV